MPYATLDNLRGPDGYLNQFVTVEGEADTSNDTVLQDVLDRAESFVNASIGAASSLAAAASATRVIYGNNLQTLLLPPHTAGSVSLVAVPSGYTVPDYIEQDGALVITDSSGIVVSPYRAGLAYAYGSTVVWQYGVPYTVTASWGWSASDLALLTEATLQTAVQLWRYREAGGSGTIGSAEAIIPVQSGWTPLVREGLDNIKRRLSTSVGVW